jgi:hypothetical protein
MPQPPKKLTPKIILEGTRLTHKTDIAFALNEHPRIVGPRRYRYHSPVISAEWCAFTNSPWGRGPINFAPEEEARAIETYATWARLFELMPYYSWIVDRFHLSTQVFQASQGRHYDFRWLEERLLPLRFAVIACRRSPESFAKAREERLKISGNPGQYDDLGLFIREQEALARALEASLLPRLDVDVSDGDIPRICGQIADWMEERDLLGMP